jgi:uncharacterized protein (TIGR01777 family)
VKVVVAGGSGALGRRICSVLAARGDEPVVLTRSPGPPGRYRQVYWDGRTAGGWVGELDGAAVVNLAGALVDRRPGAGTVELLTRSRVEPTRALARAAAAVDRAPPVWLQMSTLAIYGDAGEAVLDEAAVPAADPPQMAGVARAWEAAAGDAPADRQVVLRTAVVLDRDGPALRRLTALTRYGLGGRLGTGRQWVSWLHVRDFLALTVRVLTDDTLHGIIHATAPHPVRNAELMAELRRVLHRPPSPPTPAALVRVGAFLLRTDPALALTGRRAVPARLLRAGFTFQHPRLGPALDDLLATPPTSPPGPAGD